MNKREVFKHYTDYSNEFERVYSLIKEGFGSSSVYSTELCKLRGYVSDEQKRLIEDMEIGICNIDDAYSLGTSVTDLGLVSKDGYFLLDGRYVIPIRDIEGRLIALVGYFPDNKKYITTPSMYFSKEVQFFNIDHAYPLSLEKYNGVVFLVEGIFDCLSMRSIGLPCIATMGSTVGSLKKEILQLFRKVIYIPDNDVVGNRALNRFDKRYGWAVPSTATGIRLKGCVNIGGTMRKVKDVDNLVSWFDADTVRDSLLQFADSKEDIEVLEL